MVPSKTTNFNCFARSTYTWEVKRKFPSFWMCQTGKIKRTFSKITAKLFCTCCRLQKTKFLNYRNIRVEGVKSGGVSNHCNYICNKSILQLLSLLPDAMDLAWRNVCLILSYITFLARRYGCARSLCWENWICACLSVLLLYWKRLKQSWIITARKRSLRRLCFYRCLSVHRGGRAWLLPGGACVAPRGGHAWLLWGGVRGCSGGACVVAPGGCAWFYSAGGRAWFYSAGGCVVLFSGGHAWFYSAGGHVWFYSAGGCMVLFSGGACMVLFSGGACVVLFSGGACVVLFSRGVHGFIQRGGMHGFIQWGGVRGFIQRGGMRGFIQRGGVRGFIQRGGRAWFFQFFRIQWDTVNERAVRILLECILVVYITDFIEILEIVLKITMSERRGYLGNIKAIFALYLSRAAFVLQHNGDPKGNLSNNCFHQDKNHYENKRKASYR